MKNAPASLMLTVVWLSAATCNPVEQPTGFTGSGPNIGSGSAAFGSAGSGNPSSRGGTSGGVAAGGVGGRVATGGTATGGVPCSLPASTERPHPGVYDYKSCMDCHGDTYWGGWVYSNAAGDAWVADATVTLTGTDGIVVTMHAAKDGFFSVKPAETKVPTAFTPCVSKCSDRNCATQIHESADCQTAACHGTSSRLIYLTSGSSQGTGGIGGGGANCKPPTSGGPRAHDPSFDGQACTLCHDAAYNGGYLYDGISSNNPVALATLTITPTGGAPITAVTGPGGLFQVQGLKAPYVACVSKCPNTLCSSSASHPNTDDCSTCHNDKLRIHLP